jgi:hypothetical protein
MDKGRGKLPVILRRVREEKRAREGKARKTGWLDGLVRGREGRCREGSGQSGDEGGRGRKPSSAVLRHVPPDDRGTRAACLKVVRDAGEGHPASSGSSEVESFMPRGPCALMCPHDEGARPSEHGHLQPP